MVFDKPIDSGQLNINSRKGDAPARPYRPVTMPLMQVHVLNQGLREMASAIAAIEASKNKKSQKILAKYFLDLLSELEQIYFSKQELLESSEAFKKHGRESLFFLHKNISELKEMISKYEHDAQTQSDDHREAAATQTLPLGVASLLDKFYPGTALSRTQAVNLLAAHLMADRLMKEATASLKKLPVEEQEGRQLDQEKVIAGVLMVSLACSTRQAIEVIKLARGGDGLRHTQAVLAAAHEAGDLAFIRQVSDRFGGQHAILQQFESKAQPDELQQSRDLRDASKAP